MAEEPQRTRRGDRHIASPQEPSYNDQPQEPGYAQPRRPSYGVSDPRVDYDDRNQQYPQAYTPPQPPIKYQPAPEQVYEPVPPQPKSRITCKKCGSTNVEISREQTGSKSGVKGMGCLWGIGRALLIICTLGLWSIFGRKRGTMNTKNKFRTIAVCQDCGKSWYV